MAIFAVSKRCSHHVCGRALQGCISGLCVSVFLGLHVSLMIADVTAHLSDSCQCAVGTTQTLSVVALSNHVILVLAKTGARIGYR